jgi:hypothetical protein
MNDTSRKIAFLAVLIYEDGPGRCCEELRVYSATHPEIAYQLALADGNEQRYGRRFLGLSHLEETTQEVEPIARSQKGHASELVISRDALLVFSDPRWKGIQCDDAELANALREPPLLLELAGLNDVPWHQYTHAYGFASDVPKDVRRLASSESSVREQALWQLFGSIYHQGTLYSATAVATPFLLRLVLDTRLPDRSKLCELLDALAASATVDPSKLRKAWAWRRENFGEIFMKPTEEMAESKVANFLAVRRVFLDRMDSIKALQSDSDTEVPRWAASIVKRLESDSRAT